MQRRAPRRTIRCRCSKRLPVIVKNPAQWRGVFLCHMVKASCTWGSEKTRARAPHRRIVRRPSPRLLTAPARFRPEGFLKRWVYPGLSQVGHGDANPRVRGLRGGVGDPFDIDFGELVSGLGEEPRFIGR